MLQGIARESIGKKAARELRRDGYLLANIYGKGVANVLCAFKRNEFIKFMRNKETLKFPVSVAGNVYEVVVQDYQKDPVTNELIHVDLILCQKGVVTNFQVPVRPVGTPIGLKNKGVLLQSRKRLKVRCAGENLPNEFVVDVSGLDVGDTILVRDIQAPVGVEIRIDGRVPVLGVIKAK
ncbi:MAG: 50S ribosomal protein L25/general stress protein Ctc [Campylobacterales bacterium]